MITRRRVLASGAGSLLAAPAVAGVLAERAFGLPLPQELPQGVHQSAVLDALPEKKPLIKLSYRPPNYETPIEVFREAITPNESFFVRYHLADIPDIQADTWKLSVGGDGANTPLELSLAQLMEMPAAEVVAVCQCAGNRRGLFNPHVPGVEWGYGAMGCARFKGVPLKLVLERAGLKKEAIEIVVAGADKPVVDKTPAFVKSIPTWKALEDTTLIAYEMNGKPIPRFNGFPARLIVPGWTGTYWMKHLVSISAETKPFDGFWMKSAYRVPLRTFPMVAGFSSQETGANTPITEMVVNSLIASPLSGAAARVGQAVAIRGIAWDAGYGIRSVDLSADDGKTWFSAKLGDDLGRFAFRTWSAQVTPRKAGHLKVMARATNRLGQTQASELVMNPAGYHHNVMHAVSLVVA